MTRIEKPVKPFASEVEPVKNRPAPLPTAPPSENELIAGWPSGPPLLTVLCATYQHEKFVADALRGILSQQTDFPFEVIVRDDGSTDNTPDIIRDFERRYPHIVRTVLEPEHTGQLGPFRGLRPLARGAFIAQCDGDDYWCRTDKLQRQVEQLRRYPKAVLSHHQAYGVKDGCIVDESLTPRRSQGFLTSRRLTRGAYLVVSSVVHRNVTLATHPFGHLIPNDDDLDRVLLAEHGGAIFLPGLPSSVYRYHQSSRVASRSAHERAAQSFQSHYWISVGFSQAGSRADASFFLRQAILAVWKGAQSGEEASRPTLSWLARFIVFILGRRGLELFQRLSR